MVKNLNSKDDEIYIDNYIDNYFDKYDENNIYKENNIDNKNNINNENNDTKCNNLRLDYLRNLDTDLINIKHKNCETIINLEAFPQYLLEFEHFQTNPDMRHFALDFLHGRYLRLSLGIGLGEQ